MQTRNVLRGEMAKYGLTIKDIAEIIGISYQAMFNKLHGKTEFTLTEAKKIVSYFNSQGESHSVETLFFPFQSNIMDTNNKEAVGR